MKLCYGKNQIGGEHEAILFENNEGDICPLCHAFEEIQHRQNEIWALKAIIDTGMICNCKED